MGDLTNYKNFLKLLVLLGAVFTTFCGGCAENVVAPQVIDSRPSEEFALRPKHYEPKSGAIKTTQNIEPADNIRIAIPEAPADWMPPSKLDKQDRWRGILIHHSGVYYGCAAHEDAYHKSIGWDGLGYHFVINNGVFQNGFGRRDGAVEVGYRWREQITGAHCRVVGDNSNYWNERYIGICLIGNFNEGRPSEKQWASLVKLVAFLQQRYGIPESNIRGHRDIKQTDCPGQYFSFQELYRRLKLAK